MITQRREIVEALISEVDDLITAREPEQRQWREAKADARRRVRWLSSATPRVRGPR